MKTITTAVLVLFLTAGSLHVSAQKKSDSKSVFTAFPGIIEISVNTLKNTLVAKPGQTVNIPFNDKFVFTGKVMSNEMKYSDLQSMVIKSDVYIHLI